MNTPVYICSDIYTNNESYVTNKEIQEYIVKNDVNSNLSSVRAALFNTKLWPKDTTLNVVFMGGEPWKHAWVEKVITEQFMPYSNIKFSFDPSGKKTIRISFDEKQGAYSAVGTDALNRSLNESTMNLGWLDAPGSKTSSGSFTWKGQTYTIPPGEPRNNNEIGATVMHEFGHAIGMIHEHQNPRGQTIDWDVDKVYKKFSGPPNKWDKDTINRNILKKYNENQINGSDFDPQSIMLYFFPAELTKNGQGTVANSNLSQLDKMWMANAYANAPSPTMSQTTTNNNLTSPIINMSIPPNITTLTPVNITPQLIQPPPFGSPQPYQPPPFGSPQPYQPQPFGPPQPYQPQPFGPPQPYQSPPVIIPVTYPTNTTPINPYCNPQQQSNMCNPQQQSNMCNYQQNMCPQIPMCPKMSICNSTQCVHHRKKPKPKPKSRCPSGTHRVCTKHGGRSQCKCVKKIIRPRCSSPNYIYSPTYKRCIPKTCPPGYKRNTLGLCVRPRPPPRPRPPLPPPPPPPSSRPPCPPGSVWAHAIEGDKCLPIYHPPPGKIHIHGPKCHFGKVCAQTLGRGGGRLRSEESYYEYAPKIKGLGPGVKSKLVENFQNFQTSSSSSSPQIINYKFLVIVIIIIIIAIMIYIRREQ